MDRQTRYQFGDMILCYVQDGQGRTGLAMYPADCLPLEEAAGQPEAGAVAETAGQPEAGAAAAKMSGQPEAGAAATKTAGYPEAGAAAAKMAGQPGAGAAAAKTAGHPEAGAAAAKMFGQPEAGAAVKTTGQPEAEAAAKMARQPDDAARYRLRLPGGMDPLVQVKLVGDIYKGCYAPGNTLRDSESAMRLVFAGQTLEEDGAQRRVRTVLRDDRGYEAVHTAVWEEGARFVRMYCTYENQSKQPIRLELLSSFSLTGLSAYLEGNGSGDITVHRLQSRWSQEGRLQSQTLEELQLETAWNRDSVRCERFGQVGSLPVNHYFPFLAVEDTKHHVFWGAQLAHPASWQMELYRFDENLAVSGGLADREFGHWMKELKPGERFTTPEAIVSVAYIPEERIGLNLSSQGGGADVGDRSGAENGCGENLALNLNSQDSGADVGDRSGEANGCDEKLALDLNSQGGGADIGDRSGAENGCGENLALDLFCQRLTEAGEKAADAGPACEQELPIIFNEYCATWGCPSHENIVNILEAIRGRGFDYFVIDCGWYKADGVPWDISMGDYLPSRTLFPQGLEKTVQAIHDEGMKAGIWFEIENVGHASDAFHQTDHLLRRDGFPLTTTRRRFWDMNDPWVQDYLGERVIGTLKKYRFDYMKVDYNDTIGVGCDGAESPGEGLRRNMEATMAFFARVREEVPGIILENCASGGHRLEPGFMAATSMASFSDAHECVEIPIIASNVQRAILPRQSQIWSVIRETDSRKRIAYSVAATFLGRMCLSGDVTNLSEEQWDVIGRGIAFYRRIAPIIKKGQTYHLSPQIAHIREPEGWQAVLRVGSGEAKLPGHADGKGCSEHTDEKGCSEHTDGKGCSERTGDKDYPERTDGKDCAERMGGKVCPESTDGKGCPEAQQSCRDAYLVLHTFGGAIPNIIRLPLPSGTKWRIADCYSDEKAEVWLENGQICCRPRENWRAVAVYLAAESCAG